MLLLAFLIFHVCSGAYLRSYYIDQLLHAGPHPLPSYLPQHTQCDEPCVVSHIPKEAWRAWVVVSSEGSMAARVNTTLQQRSPDWHLYRVDLRKERHYDMGDGHSTPHPSLPDHHAHATRPPAQVPPFNLQSQFNRVYFELDSHQHSDYIFVYPGKRYVYAPANARWQMYDAVSGLPLSHPKQGKGNITLMEGRQPISPFVWMQVENDQWAMAFHLFKWPSIPRTDPPQLQLMYDFHADRLEVDIQPRPDTDAMLVYGTLLAKMITSSGETRFIKLGNMLSLMDGMVVEDTLKVKEHWNRDICHSFIAAWNETRRICGFIVRDLELREPDGTLIWSYLSDQEVRTMDGQCIKVKCEPVAIEKKKRGIHQPKHTFTVIDHADYGYESLASVEGELIVLNSSDYLQLDNLARTLYNQLRLYENCEITAYGFAGVVAMHAKAYYRTCITSLTTIATAWNGTDVYTHPRRRTPSTLLNYQLTPDAMFHWRRFLPPSAWTNVKRMVWNARPTLVGFSRARDWSASPSHVFCDVFAVSLGQDTYLSDGVVTTLDHSGDHFYGTKPHCHYRHGMAWQN